jgi:hypothetical protein
LLQSYFLTHAFLAKQIWNALTGMSTGFSPYFMEEKTLQNNAYNKSTLTPVTGG